jgi:hypothetical protein
MYTDKLHSSNVLSLMSTGRSPRALKGIQTDRRGSRVFQSSKRAQKESKKPGNRNVPNCLLASSGYLALR